MAASDPFAALLGIIARPQAADRPQIRDLSALLGRRFRNPQLATEPVEGLVGAMETVIRIVEGKPCLWQLDKAQARARAALEQCRRLALA